MLERWLAAKLQHLIGEYITDTAGGKPFSGKVFIGFPPPRGSNKLVLPAIALTSISTVLDSSGRRYVSRRADGVAKTITTDYQRWDTELRLQIDLIASRRNELVGTATWAGYGRQLLDLFALRLMWMQDEQGRVFRCRVLSPPRLMPEPTEDYERQIMEIQIDYGVFEQVETPQIGTEGIVTTGEVK